MRRNFAIRRCTRVGVLQPWNRKEFQFLTFTSFSCFNASFVNIFSPFMFSSLVDFFIWFTCFILNTFKTRSIILEVKHSSLLSNFLFLFFISSRISSLARLVVACFPPFAGATLSSLAHQIRVSLLSINFFSSLIRFFRRTKWTIYQPAKKHSLLPSTFFFPFFSWKNVRSESKSFHFGVFCGNLFLFSSVLADISTAIKETKHHCRYIQSGRYLFALFVLDTKLFPRSR